MSLPVGPKVDLPPSLSHPTRLTLPGQRVTLVPLAAEHEPDLHSCLNQPSQSSLWTYIPIGPFPNRESFKAHIDEKAASADPLIWAVVPKKTGRAGGHVALLRIDPLSRVVEIGHVLYGEGLQVYRHRFLSLFPFLYAFFFFFFAFSPL